MDGTKGHNRHLEADMLSNTQPVYTNKHVGDVVRAMNAKDQTGSSILDRLHGAPSDAGCRKTA
jgi:hypothetical protein